ncbi:uncharacterized protein N7506_001293 [Penicillium brevicompactum]|uniref:uncharacterized protein n=1 Tax=Penicillium brevicompactum TaxID=5074 RepID=UPI00253F8FB5|nr:uncharacterized protein N7506_001293 [Penicillium brevicompactum]KAJ5348040.1 hypothetical protein N7506_001293 [Penicillium brevicompactum]
MQVPNVTLEDLQAFQSKHFLGDHQHQSAEQNDLTTDDDLGYYPDGVKRTLTDEQIKMFRHSEIHSLLRKRQLQEENAEYEARAKLSAHEEEPDKGTVSEKRALDAETSPGSSADHEDRPGKRRGSKMHHAEAEAATAVPLDYGDKPADVPPPTANPPISRAPYQGRRIISYDD